MSFGGPAGTAGGLLDAFDDAQVAVDGLAEHSEGLLIAGAVMRGDRLVDAVELDDHHPLQYPGLVGLRRCAAGLVRQGRLAW